MSYSPPRRPLRFARSLFLSGAAALLLAPLAAGAQDSASTATAQSRAKNADWLYAGSDIPRDTAWQFGVLPNGVRYAVRNNGVPPGQVSICVRMDVGSMFETDEERGYAHLLEHLTFLGSDHIPDGEIGRAHVLTSVTHDQLV